jgi:hypothetical protein
VLLNFRRLGVLLSAGVGRGQSAGRVWPRRHVGWAEAVKPRARYRSGREGRFDRIKADSLRGNLAFLASDLLEGRNTPSKGLDIAAEYLATQMMRAGVRAGGRRGWQRRVTFRSPAGR